MDRKVVEKKPKLVKYQVYLGKDLQEALQRYIQDEYPPNTSVITAVFRKAIADFLEKEGYYGNGNKQANS